MLYRVMFVLVLLSSTPLISKAGTYSRSATRVSLNCDDRRTCRPVSVRSPDGTMNVRRDFQGDAKDHPSFPEVRVITPKGTWELNVPFWVDVDVLWSPDSQFIALSGNYNGYTNGMVVFRVSDSGLVEIDAAREPFEDMLRRFPPCRAANADEELCKQISAHEDYLNFAAVDWSGQHTLVVMSEVPPGGQYGGILGQVMGYEVELPSGKIERTMTAREFKARWQHSMPWRFSIPESPEWQQ
jgi:hypothetical protein